MEDSKKIKVVNKSAGVVAYSLPELNNLYRTFNKDESKEVTFGEMRMLSYIPGGDVLIKDYLTIMDKDAVAELIGEVEPEYYEKLIAASNEKYGIDVVERMKDIAYNRAAQQSPFVINSIAFCDMHTYLAVDVISGNAKYILYPLELQYAICTLKGEKKWLKI